MAHLIKIGFGPVHGFITAARKLEDLCSGSTMLSELMKEAAKKLGQDLIYPVLPSDNSKANMPNIMLLKTDSDPKELAESIISGIKKQFCEQVDKAVKSQELDIDTNLLDAVINRQTSEFVETVWSTVELGPSFEETLAELNMRFDAAKRTRMFSQHAEPGMKCTLQTNLSALAPKFESGNPDQKTKEWWKKLEDREMRSYEGRALKNSSKLSQKGERFSSIGLAKRVKARVDDGTHHFPSTYAIATALWRKRIFENCGHEKFNADVFNSFFEKWSDLKDGGDIEFNTVPEDVIPALPDIRDSVENLPDNLEMLLTCEAQCFRKTEFRKGTSSKDPIAKERKELVTCAKNIGAGSPPGHFVLLAADGDSMGRFVDACESEKELSELSNKLKDFSEQAIKTIESPEVCGRMIYAGGDDVLAVMPVDEAIKTACELRRAYREKLAGIEYTEDGKQIPATLSAALLYAPDNYPLHRLLDNAEATLNGKAKAAEKNALAITVYKGNDEVSATVLPSELDGWQFDTWAEGLESLFNEKKLSSKTMHDLHRDLQILESGKSCDPDLIKSVVLGRIATNRELDETDMKLVQERLEVFFKARVNKFRNSPPSLIAATMICLRNIWRMQCL
ncbi:type III-B CRISPR-associated protein Cas10/Cmr2 [Maridesulfovibrio sp.]|uniref:type III-B CRISPR-associated protein Cas10/Cmr2 n=1 Tax=Maridesulfovibrio sp. TaxID=2795000 RepID=UPI0029F4FF81|nr:type III-B CRISPR-associated protein Cas10/Cmr2 [Maridesulfovibrio sp.]